MSPITDEEDLKHLMAPEDDQPEYLICKVIFYSTLRLWDVQLFTSNVKLECNG